jgi:putative DNA primase/helicase
MGGLPLATVSESVSTASAQGVEKPRGRVQLNPDRHAIPAELLADPRFVTWRYEGEKSTKVPYTPDGRRKANKNAPGDRGAASACIATVAMGAVDGIGFVLGDGWVGLDFDKALDEAGHASPELQRLVEPLLGVWCYAEVSPSGTGVKFVLRADGAALRALAAEITGRNPTDEYNKFTPALPGIKEIQVNHSGGYFTLTGVPWGGPKWDGQRWDDATAAVGEVMRRAHAMKFRAPAKRHEAPIRLALDLADGEVLDRAFAAKNGARVRAIYDGNNADHGGDASAADCALAAQLAFYCGPNGHEQVKRIMRASPRWREKLEREDYMDATVATGYRGLTEFYEPARRRTEPSRRRESKAEQAAHEFALTDAFRKIHHGHLVWSDQDRWFVVDEDSGVFREDPCGSPLGTAIDTVRSVLDSGTHDEATKNKCFRVSVANAVLRASRGYRLEDGGMAVRHADLNRDPWLLGTPAGVLDLRTGETRKGTAADLVTKTTKVAPAATADASTCPLWLEFMDFVTGENANLAAFLQRWAGYALTGDLSEHAVLWLCGPGGTGKSTFIETLSHVLGDYAATMSPQVFLSDDHGHPTAVASLHGSRFASCSEFPEGKPLNEARMKRLTGGDTITARFMHQDEFSFRMQAKIIAATNHKPRLVAVSDAMARRLHVVEMGHKLDESGLRERVHRDLKTHMIQNEGPGILRWMLDGLESLLKQRAAGGGLNPPASVRDATAAYVQSQDTLSEWWEECFTYNPKQATFVATSELLDSWERWAAQNKVDRRLDSIRLSEFLYDKHGIQAKASPRSRQGPRCKGYHGVATVSAQGYDYAAQAADGCTD